MSAIGRFKAALQKHQIKETIIEQVFDGYESISDRSTKSRKAAFFVQAMDRIDILLDNSTCRTIRESCACSTGGWRLKAMKKIAQEYAESNLEDKLAAIAEVPHMGNPSLNPDGTITAGIEMQGGFHCPCPVFESTEWEGRISKTYCYCCAGHILHLYQIALNRPLETVDIVSSALLSNSQEPCRFLYRITEGNETPSQISTQSNTI